MAGITTNQLTETQPVALPLIFPMNRVAYLISNVGPLCSFGVLLESDPVEELSSHGSDETYKVKDILIQCLN